MNVELDKHERVVDMIRRGGRQLDLLVIDDASDRLFADENATLSRDQPLVELVVCPDEHATNADGLCKTTSSMYLLIYYVLVQSVHRKR